MTIPLAGITSGAPGRTHLQTEVLIVGAGAAGMSAALAAARAGASVILVDRSLIGRSGATVMAQMTVAAALGDEVPDSAEAHHADTMRAGRGLCDGRLAAIVCEEGAAAIRQLGDWHVGWAAHEDGRLRQAQAPGHDRPRCVYVDFLNTGPAVSKTLRGQVQRQSGIRRIGDLYVTDVVVSDGAACGAVGFSVASGEAVSIAASTVILTTGGLTRLYARNSASANMGGDGYALALRAGAELVDMEFVQFFPIGHLAPRMIGMDPIMWDPFRYKLGGRLLNSEGREFLDDYGAPEAGRYVATRDLATFSILKEVQAGRGSPSGGAFLSFEHVPADTLRAAFGPVIDRLGANGIDLTRMPVEVAPIAHYHMGGVRVAPTMESSVANLLVAGEAVGGSNGANRLSGNAITEALVFGTHAGRLGAERAKAGPSPWRDADAAPLLDLVTTEVPPHDEGRGALEQLQHVMATKVGPLRSEGGLREALAEIAVLRTRIGERPPGRPLAFDLCRVDWFDLRSMLVVAEAVVTAALLRTESRGAHQREDHPELDDDWTLNQLVTLRDGVLRVGTAPVASHGRAGAGA